MAQSSTELPVRGVIPIDQLFGDEENTRLLLEMASKAQSYISKFSWCRSVRETYFGDGYGKVVAVFFFHIEPSRPDVDEWLWVVVGDLPSAYLVIDACKTPSQALEGYIGEMSEWVKLAKEGRSSKDVIPVNAPATPESAGMLEARLKVLSERIVPALQANEAVPS
ncbi:MAG: hypothetical protein ABR865_06565 [Terracidiphilus sp.]|jgi:hypothetical protein